MHHVALDAINSKGMPLDKAVSVESLEINNCCVEITVGHCVEFYGAAMTSVSLSFELHKHNN